jgi:diguanylate cyclase (GGDEF)-like protein
VVLDQRYWEADLAFTIKLLKDTEPLALFKIDLDHFKPVNDALGHATGDEAIKLYCSIVREVLASVGEVYRRGGDEVIVIAPGLPEARARELAEKLRLEIEKQFRDWARNYGGLVAPTGSIGLVVTVGPAPIPNLIRLIDEAETQAKQQGKNRVFFLRANGH